MVRLAVLLTAVLLQVGLVAAKATCVPRSNLSRLQTFPSKPRVFILTDILNEPDDSMSLVRYLLYANEFDTRAFCAATSTWLRDSVHPEEIRRIITVYGGIVDNLNQHVHPNFKYQSAEELLKLVTSSLPVYGKRILAEPLSEGAARLITALRESERPLYVAAWGGINTLAQALQHMDKTLSPSDAKTLRSRLRVYTISDQDNTGLWIRTRYPDIVYIVSQHGWNDYRVGTWLGIALFGNDTKTKDPWLDANIRLGTLGAQYPPVAFAMEGDTPAFLYLVQNGLGSGEHIEWGSWGGRYERPQEVEDEADGFDSNVFADTLDRVRGTDGVEVRTNQGTIWRWRDAYQDDFAARMQWTLTSKFSNASHPPVLSINGTKGPAAVRFNIAENGTVILDASGTYDPDHPQDSSALDFQWYIYTDVNDFWEFLPGFKLEALAPPANTTGVLARNDAGFANVTLGPVVKITAPPIRTNRQTKRQNPDFHIILQVTNKSGKYPIRRYMRAIFQYAGQP